MRVLRRVIAVAALGLVPGCYRPSVASCQYECNAELACPAGLSCNADGQCADETGVCTHEAIDAPFGTPVDAQADARPDSPPDSPPALPCFGSTGFSICLEANPSAMLTLAGPIDTDSDLRCMGSGEFGTNQPYACVVIAQTITIASGTTFSASGSRPLVLVASDSVTIAGTLEVASHVGGAIGAGSDPLACMLGGAATAPSGGAGGSFRSEGGAGGTANASTGGTAGNAVGVPSVLRGGCTGEHAGGSSSGAGGPGGGALYVVGGMTLSITGLINASGAGGGIGPPNSGNGGGGGGSGGMIVLWAPAISGGGAVMANGGGGGSGEAYGAQNVGSDPADPAVPAAGGVRQTSSNYGDGGAGSTGMADGVGPAGNGGAGGAGGGGGGAGYVRSNQPLAGPVSPLADVAP